MWPSSRFSRLNDIHGSHLDRELCSHQALHRKRQRKRICRNRVSDILLLWLVLGNVDPPVLSLPDRSPVVLVTCQWTRRLQWRLLSRCIFQHLCHSLCDGLVRLGLLSHHRLLVLWRGGSHVLVFSRDSEDDARGD